MAADLGLARDDNDYETERAADRPTCLAVQVAFGFTLRAVLAGTAKPGLRTTDWLFGGEFVKLADRLGAGGLGAQGPRRRASREAKQNAFFPEANGIINIQCMNNH